MPRNERIRSTTIIAVVRNGVCAVAGDGQVTAGDMVMKQTAKKIRSMHNGKVITGFAGSTADALTLFDQFEKQIEQYSGNLRRAAVEMSKLWRTDKFLRRLDAMLIAADAESVFVLSGDGDVIEPDDGIAAIGSGGGYALAAARALLRNTELTTPEITRKAIEIAAEICIYTNHEITLASIDKNQTSMQ